MIIIRSVLCKNKVHRLATEVRKLFNNGKILIIDTERLSEIFEFITDYTQINEISHIEKIIEKESDYYQYFAININASENDISYWKQIEDKYKTNLLLTVQDHNIGNAILVEEI